MRTFLTIGLLLFTLLAIIEIRQCFRIYHRAGLYAFLFEGVSFIIGLLTIWSIYLIMTEPNISGFLCANSQFCDKFLLKLLMGLFVVAFFLHVMYYALIFTKESGLWKEIGENITYRQAFTGNIPITKWEKRPPPLMKRRTGIIIGISLMVAGSLISILIVVSTLFHFFINFFIVSVASFTLGLLLVIFSIAYLANEERNNDGSSFSSRTTGAEDDKDC